MAASNVALDNTPRATERSIDASVAATVVAAPTRDRAAAGSFDSFPAIAEPPAVARGVDVASLSNGVRGSDSHPVAQTGGRQASSIDATPAIFETRDNVRAPADAPLDAMNISAAASDASANEASRTEAAPEPIGTLAILAPPTQLPSAFAELLAPQARSLIATASMTRAAPSAAAITAPGVEAQRQSVAPKILTIELEPATLGAVVVKMKLAHSGIDMHISVASTEALRRLDSTRDQLVEAMQSSGCSVDSCTIQIAQNAADGGNAQATPDSGAGFAQSGGAGAGRDEQSVGRQGAGYGGQGGDRRQGAGGETNEPGSNGETRRVADRRGGDVYL
ncbi:flagellar hook-length control protein FliK [Methylosinus sp. H3A]|uniref:flagellar hook-length control protein FliK n=1 Tax=Methylosinus sp. H3A TaxID=2785786 RepID=UPI0018C2CA3A|nr:flagellar hook-length control protein FliK [Methylosinus sp. H3A]MBG0808598.1 flagellar hook-length control protein FliK [Methylosinus sp. H3A]